MQTGLSRALYDSNVTMLVGESGAGKTGWALRISQYQREQGRSVLYLSNEMTTEELVSYGVRLNLQLGFTLREMDPDLSLSELLLQNIVRNQYVVLDNIILQGNRGIGSLSRTISSLVNEHNMHFMLIHHTYKSNIQDYG